MSHLISQRHYLKKKKKIVLGLGKLETAAKKVDKSVFTELHLAKEKPC